MDEQVPAFQARNTPTSSTNVFLTKDVSYSNMKMPHSHDETKGFLFGGLLTYVRDTIHDARIMSDMAARYAPALSIQPWILLVVACAILFVVAKKVSGHASAVMSRLSISAFLGAAWQYILAKTAEYVST